MLTYLFIGLALGSIYALASVSLVVTYQSTGILNFAFGAMAFFVARTFYWMHSQENLNLVLSAALSILVVGPLLGLFLYLAVFRAVQFRPTLIKIVVTIGLSVAIPAIAVLLYGTDTIDTAPGLAPQPVKFWQIAGATLTLDQAIVYAFLLLVVVGGFLLLRLTDIGLRVRAIVNSHALSRLNGVRTDRVTVGVWIVSGFLAGLAGILVAPTIGLSINAFETLMACAFAAVVGAKLRSVGGAILISLAMGIVTDAVQDFLPSDSSVTTDIVLSVPFAFILVFLVIYLARTGSVGDESALGGALDKAVRFEDPGGARAPSRAPAAVQGGLVTGITRTSLGLVPLAVLAVLPLILSAYWLGLLAEGFAIAVVLISITLVTGEGGMIWLCQITFAGGGALIAAELSATFGVSPLLGAFAGGIAMIPVGTLVAALTIRLGDLYVAIVTLSLGLLIDGTVFANTKFLAGQGGVPISRPAFGASDRAFTYFVLIVIAILGFVIFNLRRSTTGLAISAIRYSERASKTLGLSVAGPKILLSAFATFCAGFGGALIAMYNFTTDLSTYSTEQGLVWLAVVVTVGARSITAALVGGAALTIIPGIFGTYLPTQWAPLPSVLFGLGALGVALDPDGVLSTYAKQLRNLLVRFSRSKPAGSDPNTPAPSAPAVPVPVPEGATSFPQPRAGLPHGRAGAGPECRTSGRPRLSAAGVTVDFGGLRALDNVSIEVGAGTIVGLIGPNGAGKSTLFSVLSGLQRPNHGTVMIDGTDVTSAGPQDRARRGLSRTFQHPELFLDLTVREHVTLAHRMATHPARVWNDVPLLRGLRRADEEESEAVTTLLDSVGLTAIQHRSVNGLPLGLTRLVEIARALARRPSVLLLDEASSGLDSRETEDLAGLLLGMVRNYDLSLLLVEHDVDLVLRLSDFIYVLDFGHLIAAGKPKEVSADVKVRAAYLGEDPQAVTR
ncbi:MAG TPA: ATP-binding cassette domain-containing protein [Trebonia sp.]|jgi:branched-chain amino acid transport system permease protein|nr:ATP-binding cassette domain-containing protein [Trebonia sp.]